MDSKKNKESFCLKKEYFEEIISYMPGHVYWKDVKGVFLGCNLQQAKDAGFDSPHEIIGKTDYEMPWSIQADYLRDIDKKVMQAGSVVDLEEFFELPDGTKKIYLSSKLPLYDENRKVSGILGISFDITDRKDMEKKLAEAIRAKGTFMSIVSHEIKGPLNNVIYILNMLKQDLLANTINVKNAITLIEKEINDASRGIETINNLLKFLNFDLSKEEIENKNAVNIRSELLKVFDEFERHNQKNIGFNVKDLDAPRAVKINVNVFTAVSIAVGNAVKYSKKNAEVDVCVSCRINNQKNYIVFKIEDAGIGINKETLSRLFKPLFDTGEVMEHVLFSAPAIRLSYAKKIVEALGGELKVMSQEGEGTQVSITVPYDLSEHIDPSISLRTFYPLNKIKTSKRKLTILVVEDNKMTSELLIKEIHKLKHTVDAALNSLDAQRLAKSKNYDAIFMDISLPGIDGVELRNKLSSPDPKVDKPIIIAVTSHDSDKDVEYFLEQGFANVIAKPFTKEDIIACIDTIQKVLTDLGY